MSVQKNVGFDKFPKQGGYLGKEVDVFFNYDSSKSIKGKVVRDDVEDPFLTLIQLEDGRIVRSVECQYS